jgi:hypothetical protein
VPNLDGDVKLRGVENSFQLRKQKAKARMQLRRRLARGEVRLDQISIAASALSCHRDSPLILTKVQIPDTELL